MVVRWLDEVPTARWLGAPPTSCLQNPQFVSCYAAQAAQAIDACKSVAIEKRGECTLYYNDFYAYQHCRNLCPEMSAPIQPGDFPPSAGGGANQNRVVPPSTSTESKTSPGLVLAGIVIVGVVIYALVT